MAIVIFYVNRVAMKAIHLHLILSAQIRIRSVTNRRTVTLAYLKGKDTELEEAQEQANSSSLALYA